MLVTEVSTTVTPVFLRTSPVSSWWMIMDALFTSLSSSTLAVSFQASVYPQKCCGCYVPVPVSWVQILLGAAFLFSGLFGSKVDPAAIGPSCIGRSAEGNIRACLVSRGWLFAFIDGRSATRIVCFGRCWYFEFFECWSIRSTFARSCDFNMLN